MGLFDYEEDDQEEPMQKFQTSEFGSTQGNRETQKENMKAQKKGGLFNIDEEEERYSEMFKPIDQPKLNTQ